MQVMDRTNTGQVSCTLYSMSPAGGVVSSSTRASGIGFFADPPVQLDFPALPAQVDGYYHVQCKVPAFRSGNGASGILMYRIVE